MGRRYYCEFCDRAFQDNVTAKKKHLSSIPHKLNREAWYDRFKDKRQKLEQELSKPKLCTHYAQSGNCLFGNQCKYRHMTDAEIYKIRSEIDIEDTTVRREQRTVAKWLEEKGDLSGVKTSKTSDNFSENEIKIHETERNLKSYYTLPEELKSLFLPLSMQPPPPEGWPVLEEVEWN